VGFAIVNEKANVSVVVSGEEGEPFNGFAQLVGQLEAIVLECGEQHRVALTSAATTTNSCHMINFEIMIRRNRPKRDK
jgi:arabinogalactan endo-1,4-beta-galactosidase